MRFDLVRLRCSETGDNDVKEGTPVSKMPSFVMMEAASHGMIQTYQDSVYIERWY